MQRVLFKVFVLSTGLIVASCDRTEQTTQKSEPENTSSSKQPFVDDRINIDSARLMRGRELYLKNCTVCHGLSAEGAPNWQQRDEDGKFPAPPLNGTGHAWHHPHHALVDTIKNGTIRLGGKMPPWKDRLSDEEINLIILWFQSQWPPELYQAWQRLDREYEKRQLERSK